MVRAEAGVGGSRKIFTVIVVYKGEVRRWSEVAGNSFNLGYDQHPQND